MKIAVANQTNDEFNLIATSNEISTKNVEKSNSTIILALLIVIVLTMAGWCQQCLLH